MKLAVEVDYPQARIKRERQATVLDGRSYDIASASGVFIEPDTKTAMLLPSVFDPAWDTTFSGRFARYRLSDFLSPSANWLETVGGKGSGDYWIESKGVVNEHLVLSSPVQANSGFYLSWFAFNPNNATEANELEAGWFKHDGSGVITERLYTFRFKTGGKVEVYEGDIFLREYSLSQRRDDVSLEDGETDEQGDSLTPDFTAIAILPFRNREILFLSASGSSFRHVIEGLPEDWQGDIVPAGYYFGVGFVNTTAKFQAAKITYPDSGTVRSKPTTFPVAPSAAQTVKERAVYYPAGAMDWTGGSPAVEASLRDLGGSPFVPDGNRDTAYMLLTLRALAKDASGHAVRSPMAYGGEAYLAPEMSATSDETTDITGAVSGLELEVSEKDIGVSGKLTIVNPESLGGSAPLLDALPYRPLRLRLVDDPLNPLTIFEGVLGDLSYFRGVRGEVERLEADIRDIYAFAESYLAADAIPFDGMALEDAVSELGEVVGLSVDAPATGFTIPAPGLDPSGDFVSFLEVGESVADGIQRLRETYAANFFVMMAPTASGYKLRFVETLSATPVKTLYSSRAEALAAGASESDVYRAWAFRVSPSLATHVFVLGRDPHTLKPIQAVVRRADVPEDPETLKASRGIFWTGFPIRYGYSDPGLVSVSLLERAAEILARRILTNRRTADFRSDMILKSDGYPVWRGDVVRLVEGTYYRDVRITAFKASFVRTADAGGSNDWTATEATYTGEIIGEGDLP